MVSAASLQVFEDRARSPQPFATDGFDIFGQMDDGLPGGTLDGETEFGGKADGAEKAEVIFFKTLAGRRHRGCGFDEMHHR